MKRLLIIPFALLLVVSGCKQSGSTKEEQEIKKEMEGIMQEAVNAAKNKKGTFDLSLVKGNMKTLGSEIPLEFQMREYPKNVKNFDQMIKNAKLAMGKATYKILESKTMDAIGIWEAKKGKKIFVVYLEIKGDKGNFGQPSSFDQTGSDPSPQFILVDQDGKKYPEQTAESNSAARSSGGKSLMTIKTPSDTWQKTAVAFTVDEDIKEPTLVIQTKVADKKYKFVGIKLQ